MGRRARPGLASLTVSLAVSLMMSSPGLGHPAGPRFESSLNRIGPAPTFTLTTQDGGRLSLRDLRDKVVVVTFLYTSCADTCPLLTAKLAAVARRLDGEAARRVAFAAITVDPERDTPTVLKDYAGRVGLMGTNWSFLTGTLAEIREVASRYGIYARRTERGDVDHTFLTSLIDGDGTLRVQYLGVRFDADELLGDLRTLLAEAPAR